jgi:teichuronic acid biosynthesis glycosyltransferase TuaC
VIRVLVFTTLYPNAAQPRHGVFVETRLRQLLGAGQVEARVLAPVPCFPVRAGGLGKYGAYAGVPRREERHGIQIEHPRFLVIPKVGRNLTPAFLYRSAAKAIRGMQREGYDFDLIDAHFFYPDGVAAVRLGELFGKPVCVTGRGSDLNVMPGYQGPRRMILEAALKAAANIVVSDSLKRVMVDDLGVPGERVRVLRNGVDLALFQPVDRAAVRTELGMARKTLLSVGNLVELKGHDLVVRALLELPDVDLWIVGEGEERESLLRLIHQLGLDERVRVIGNVSQDRLRDYYAAADALVLASSREGWPNVLLECMSCGTPVVATRVGGTPEIVTTPAVGTLIGDRSAAAIAGAVRELLSHPRSSDDIRAYASSYSWDETVAGLMQVFTQAATQPPRIPRSAPR